MPWPQGGEIDILENRGSQPNLTSAAYHWQTNPGPCCDQHRFVFGEYTAEEGGQPVDFHAGYHVYAAEWDETEVRYYVDGQMFFRVTEAPDRPIFETAKNIIVNLAVGGTFGGDPDGSTVWPQEMRIDYVRYWRRDDRLAGDYNGDGAVTAADYTLYRDSLGQSGVGLPADGSGNGSVGRSDFRVWRLAYGTNAAAAIPEPGGAVLLGVGWTAASTRTRSR